jgi:hypothetical protein
MIVDLESSYLDCINGSTIRQTLNKDFRLHIVSFSFMANHYRKLLETEVSIP